MDEINPFEKNNNLKLAKNYALNLLARREYSQSELKSKLIRFNLSELEINTLFDYLVDREFQSDQRFASSFIRASVSALRGRYKIAQELKIKGIEIDIIEQAFLDEAIDFDCLCLNRIDKYLKNYDQLNDRKVVEKLKRHLIYHGFSFDEINRALKAIND